MEEQEASQWIVDLTLIPSLKTHVGFSLVSPLITSLVVKYISNQFFRTEEAFWIRDETSSR